MTEFNASLAGVMVLYFGNGALAYVSSICSIIIDHQSPFRIGPFKIRMLQCWVNGLPRWVVMIMMNVG